MRFTDIYIIDHVMSIGVAVFIFVNAIKNLKQIENLFLEKLPDNIDMEEIKSHLLKIEGVKGVHHIHIWSMDGHNNYATMHVVCDGEFCKIKKEIREELKEHHIGHVTLELESADENCTQEHCHIAHASLPAHHHHHHHH